MLKKAVYPPSAKPKQIGFQSRHPHKCSWGQQGGKPHHYGPGKSKKSHVQANSMKEMTRYRTIVNTMYVKFNKICEPYPRVSTNTDTKAPLRGVDRPDGLDNQQSKIGWKAGPVLGTRRLCWHNYEHNRCLKALSIMLA